jgi:hypothetical protein
MEHWLHQHLFKVGWLLTKDFQTTTILYYTLFLPGVFLNQFSYWVTAGVLNIGAKPSIRFPESQEIGELRLNFIEFSRNQRINPFKRALMSATPLVIGLLVIWLIADRILGLSLALQVMSSGELDSVGRGLQQLFGTADFWLWFYVIFTISNTMYPNTNRDLQGWRQIIYFVVLLLIVASLIGIGNQLLQTVATPITSVVFALQALLIFIIIIDGVMVAILGAIESTIERITGNSATFRRGRMVVMTRQEAEAERQRERERQQQRPAPSRPSTEHDASLTSVYQLRFQVPSSSDKTSATQRTLTDLVPPPND